MSCEAPAASTPSQADINEVEWARRGNWKPGLFYYSERDNRIWIPKKSVFGRKHRLGTTPNFARREGRLYMMFLGSLLIAAILVLLVLKRLRLT